MGPNGCGKSTLAYVVAGHPKYEITGGTIELDGINVLELDPCQRARLGLFLAFQYPVTIPGVKVSDFLRHAVSNVRNPERKEGEGLIPMKDFRKELKDRMSEIDIDSEFARRLPQRRIQRRREEADGDFAVVAAASAVRDPRRNRQRPRQRRRPSGQRRINKLHGPHMGVLIITHHERLLEFNKPSFTHVMLAGKIVETGDASLAHDLHANGYAAVRERHPAEAAEEQAVTVKA